MGATHNVMVNHFHNQVANNNKGFKDSHKELWPWLAGKIIKFEVDIMMGDFNMSLFKVVPELRSRGVEIDVVAWYPWKAPDGTPMADSCGIYVVKRPGAHKLHMGLERLHDKSCEGILWTQKSGVDDHGMDEGGFDVHTVDGGPGQALKTYLPKKADLNEKLRGFLQPTPIPHQDMGGAAEKGKSKGAGKGKDRGGREKFRMGEKRLKAAVWRHKGENHKGSHFPICAFTKNTGRRSEERYQARSRRTFGPASAVADAASAVAVVHWGGCTPVVQPTDTDLHQHMKDHYYTEWQALRGVAPEWAESQWAQDWGQSVACWTWTTSV